MAELRLKRWLLAAKLLVTFALLVYLGTKLDLAQLAARMGSIDPWYYAGAVAALSLPIALTSLRWQIILRAQRITLPLRSVVSFDLVALFFNAFLPGSTGGDAARAYYAIVRFPGEKTRIIASIVLDRGLGLMVLLVFGYFALLGQSELFAGIEALKVFALYVPVLVFASLTGFLVLFFLPSSRLPRRLHRGIHAVLGRGIVGRMLLFVREQRERTTMLGAALVISVISYLANFLSAYLVGRAMGLEIAYTQVILMLAVLYTIISIPISFGGHGLREVVLIGLFAALTIGPAESAVAFSLLLFGVQLIWSLAGGAWFLLWRSRSEREGAAAWLRSET